MSDFGIIHLPVVPVRSEASDKSEQINQLVFGETFSIVEKTDKWTHIMSSFDAYEGWIDNKQYRAVTETTVGQANAEQVHIALDLTNRVMTANAQYMHVPMGSTLPQFKSLNFGWEKEQFQFYGKTAAAGSTAVSGKIQEIAQSLLNVPYQWGGRSPMGMDCSGFTQIVFKIVGKKLKRDAWQQAEQGVLVNFIEEVQPGDLIFFDNEEGRIIHVGIALGNHKIIHASGNVRIDNLDHHGIYNTETRKYSHNLRIIKRIL